MWITLAAVDNGSADGNSDSTRGLVIDRAVLECSRALDEIRIRNTNPLLKAEGRTIHTGPTNTNVNDLHSVVVVKEAHSRPNSK